MKDKKLNEYIKHLLETPREERLASDGKWAESLDCAMAMWEEKHPGTRPPAYRDIPVPQCFSGSMPPIYEGDLDK